MGIRELRNHLHIYNDPATPCLQTFLLNNGSHYTQNRKQMLLSGIRSSIWSGPIDVAVNWPYTVFILAHISLVKILTFTNTSPDGVFAFTWYLLLSDLCLSGSFLAFGPLLNCQLPWEAFHHLPSVCIPPLITPMPLPCFVFSSQYILPSSYYAAACRQIVCLHPLIRM